MVNVIMISFFYLIDKHEKRFLFNEYLGQNNLNTQEYHKIIDRQREENSHISVELDRIKSVWLVVDDVERDNGLKKFDIFEVTESKLVEPGFYLVLDNRLASLLLERLYRPSGDNKANIEYPKIFLGAKSKKNNKIVRT